MDRDDWFINEEPPGNNKKLQEHILAELSKISFSANEYGNHIAIAMEKADSNHGKSLNIDKHANNKFKNDTEKYNDLRGCLALMYDCPEYIKLYGPSQTYTQSENDIAIKNHIALYTTYILECLLGLWHIHNMGMVHCDIKEDNMVFNRVNINTSLFPEKWNPSIGQIIDFGLSKPNGNWKKSFSGCVRVSKIDGEIDIQDPDKQISAQCWGAEYFNPPEYSASYWDSSPITSRGDLYSLGKCLKDLFKDWTDCILPPNISSLPAELFPQVKKFRDICKSLLKQKINERTNTEQAINELWQLLKNLGVHESNKLSSKSFCVKALSLRGIPNSNGGYSPEDNKDIFFTNFPDIMHDDIKLLLEKDAPTI